MSRHATTETDSALEQSAAFVRFDSAGRLMEANGEFLTLPSVVSGQSGQQDVLCEYLERFAAINQDEIGGSARDRLRIVEMWKRHGGVPIEARTRDGQWRLLSVSPAGDGGALFLSINHGARRRRLNLAQLLAENIPLPMWVNRIDTGEVLYSNPASNRLYDVRPDAQENRSIAEFFPDRDDSIEMLRRLELKGSIENYPVKTKSDTGKEILVRGCASVLDHDGLKLVVNAVQDLTDRTELEEDTHKARDMLRDAIESLSEGFALYDEDGRLVMFNTRYREMNHAVEDLLEPGLDWEILMRETARRGVYADAIGREDEWISARIENGIEYIQDYELKHTDGTYYAVSVHPTKLGGFVVTRTDITARKQAEIAERDGDLLIRQVLEASPAPVVMARVGDGEILYRNPAAIELFGKRENATEYYCSIDDRADYITTLLADGRVDDYKLTLINRDGEEFPAATYGRIADYKGEEVVVTTTIDLTGQNEAEALIRKVLEACPVPVQMTNAETGRLLFRSPETTALFGPVEMAGEYYVNPQDRDEYLDILRKTGSIYEHKIQLTNAKKEPFWGSISARLIEFRGEQVVVSNTRDLTDELALQEELTSQRELLFQNEKMSALGELLAGVAHELNNPLSIVVGHSLMLREEAHEPETIKRIEKISGAAERCAKIVKTFLAMARQQPAKMENTDVNAVITTAVDVAGYGKKDEGLEIVCDLSQNMPEIVADADQITQVIINLIINAEQAILAAGEGNRISVATGSGKTGDTVEITVTDNGPGIPKNIIARIFEPFFTTKDVGDGTGIGLAFCHRIIHSHGGHIWADPDFRGGSRFVISLPAGAPGTDEDTAAGDSARSRAGVRALVVDDEVEVAELIAEILKKEGFRVTLAHSGDEAVERLGEERYDLLLSDLNMPSLDGRGLYETIRDRHPYLIDKTAFITGDTMGAASQSLLRESQRPHLEKPVSPAELRELVYGILNSEKVDG
ncbi:hybrid sensor histidine kinase/response regulator [Hoeflea poritis]|uniref:histidine kinase n=1 Tax=Hoeflea poritis TaxID=2993659 RepID=A0ABT4VM94_9HYPH|nr:ATP-binding protein [Hoeflea poritis]MDA4845724.1 PAS-domain containing protein [Hoeflea poritis]